MPTDACPTPDALERFLLGYPLAQESERLAAHVENCPSCLSTLHSLDGADLLLQTMRDPSLAASAPHDQTVARLIESVRALWPRPSAVE